MPTQSRGTQLGRCYRLVAALVAGKQLDREGIAQMLGIKKAAADKHIKELIEHLRTAIDVQRRGNKKALRWRGEGKAVNTSRSLAVAASFGASVARLFRGTSYATLLDETRKRVVDHLKAPDEFAHARRKFLFICQAGEVALPDRQGLLDDLVEAVLKQHPVEVQYTSFDGAERIETMAPWSLAIYDHQLYVLGGDAGGSPRPYRLSRIRRHRVITKQTFEYPPPTTYDPEHLFRDSFGIFIRGEGEVADVRLRFQPRWRTFATTHMWHSTHQVERDDDAGIVVRMRVRVCRELEAFVLGFGAEVEVLAPLGLRARIAERAAALATLYQATTTAPASHAPPIEATPRPLTTQVGASRGVRSRRTARRMRT